MCVLCQCASVCLCSLGGGLPIENSTSCVLKSCLHNTHQNKQLQIDVSTFVITFHGHAGDGEVTLSLQMFPGHKTNRGIG